MVTSSIGRSLQHPKITFVTQKQVSATMNIGATLSNMRKVKEVIVSEENSRRSINTMFYAAFATHMKAKVATLDINYCNMSRLSDFLFHRIFYEYHYRFYYALRYILCLDTY